MFRYMAILWNATDPVQANTAEHLMMRLRSFGMKWRCAFSQPGACVYCTGERGSTTAHTLSEGRGVILGTLFEGSRYLERCEHANGSLDAQSSERILSSGGRELTTAYWGNYVAVLYAAGGNIVRLLRGPASSLPCLHVIHGQVQVCFSSMEDCRNLNFRSFSVDWDYIAVHMIARVPTERTGLQGVTEVQPGECLEIRPGRVSKHVYWDRLQIANTGIIDDPREAVDQLRRSVKMCVHSWAACHQNILHHLSGGLDSSIVLACLRDAPMRPRITCVTEYSHGPDSDEREFARLAVRSAGCCAHIEQQRNSGVAFEKMLDAVISAAPQNYFRRVELAEWQMQLARERNATAIFYGIGGDQLFFQHGLLSVADFVHRRCFNRKLLQIAYDAAQVELLSIWSVLGRSIYRGLWPHRHDPLADVVPYRRLVSSRVVDAVKAQYAVGVPWCQSTRNAPVGKLQHIYALSLLPDYYNPLGHDGDPVEVAPLLSQPLIETALRIPTYVLMVDGWDRGLARRAFASDLPPEIARRRSKGGIAEHAYSILRTNLSFCRALLLDGLLVQHGLIDRGRLVEALADRPSSIMKGMTEIGWIISIEAWLRRWMECERLAV